MARPVFQVRPLRVWPEKETLMRRNSQFSVPLVKTIELLARELDALEAHHVILEVVAPSAAVRQDGLLRADARVEHPGAILSFLSSQGPLRYVSDTFVHPVPASSWQANLRAIALGLEALRKIDRYGITHSGEQYRGWSALGAGPVPEAEPDVRLMSREDAARWLISHLPDSLSTDVAHLLASAQLRSRCYRLVSRQMHPDTGGTTAKFQMLQSIKKILEG